MSKIWICQGFRDRRIEERNRNSKTRNRSTRFRTRNSSLEDRGRRRGKHGSATVEATKCKGFIFFYRVFQRNKTKKLITLLRLSYFLLYLVWRHFWMTQKVWETIKLISFKCFSGTSFRTTRDVDRWEALTRVRLRGKVGNATLGIAGDQRGWTQATIFCLTPLLWAERTIWSC